MDGLKVCKKIRCKDYLTGEGEPAWCFQAGQPAEVAVLKCPKAMGVMKNEASKSEGGKND